MYVFGNDSKCQCVCYAYKANYPSEPRLLMFKHFIIQIMITKVIEEWMITTTMYWWQFDISKYGLKWNSIQINWRIVYQLNLKIYSFLYKNDMWHCQNVLRRHFVIKLYFLVISINFILTKRREKKNPEKVRSNGVLPFMIRLHTKTCLFINWSMLWIWVNYPTYDLI